MRNKKRDTLLGFSRILSFLFVDIQYRFLYIQLTQKRALILIIRYEIGVAIINRVGLFGWELRLRSESQNQYHRLGEPDRNVYLRGSSG